MEVGWVTSGKCWLRSRRRIRREAEDSPGVPERRTFIFWAGPSDALFRRCAPYLTLGAWSAPLAIGSFRYTSPLRILML